MRTLPLLTLFAFLPLLAPPAVRAEDSAAEKSAAVVKVDGRAEASSPWSVFEELLRGNQRYVQGKAACQADYSGRRSELVDGQKPKAIILSCSDSRVPPEIIFGQGLGDLFVVRTAGEVADRASIASIEYAIEHLGSKLLVVMGHESCGAVKAALTVGEGASAGSPDLDYLLKQIRPDLGSSANAGADKFLKEPVRVHAQGVAKRLAEQSAIVKEAVEKGQLLVVSGVYQLATGKVDFIF